MGNIVRVDGDEAHGAFALERAEPLLDARRGQAMVSVANDVNGDEIAVAGILGLGGCDGKLPAELFFVDRNQPAAASG